MARKQRLNGKWKQIGCSIVSVGILSCGAGYRTRSPGYLPFTGPAEVRIEQPRQRSQIFVLEPLIVTEQKSLDQDKETELTNIKTTTVPPLKETQISTSSRPMLAPPPLEQVPRQKTAKELGREFLPDGFVDDLFNEPFLDNRASLRMFLDFFRTNQVQQSTNDPYQIVPPSTGEPDANDAPTSGDQTSTTT